MEKLIKTRGLDLKGVIEEARANDNEEFAIEVEKVIANMQACYDVIAERYTTCGYEDLWKIDVEYLKMKLK